ncbi:hypothetical protein NL676_030755 [Syzygium grande]|nr:hypothetical protein NL676_030755 [Syzygium grande]
MIFPIAKPLSVRCPSGQTSHQLQRTNRFPETITPTAIKCCNRCPTWRLIRTSPCELKVHDGHDFTNNEQIESISSRTLSCEKSGAFQESEQNRIEDRGMGIPGFSRAAGLRGTVDHRTAGTTPEIFADLDGGITREIEVFVDGASRCWCARGSLLLFPFFRSRRTKNVMSLCSLT